MCGSGLTGDPLAGVFGDDLRRSLPFSIVRYFVTFLSVEFVAAKVVPTRASTLER